MTSGEELHEMYRGHRVVAFPQRGRTMMETDNTTRNGKPRPRSLSAGRSRLARNNDLVQDVYDRLGVSRGGEWGAPIPQLGSTTDDSFHQDGGDGKGDVGLEVTDFDFAAAAPNSPFQTQKNRTLQNPSPNRPMSPDEQPMHNSSHNSSINKDTQKDGTKKMFSERFHAAASRGRGREAERTPSPSSPAGAQERRSRSLSRGRMAQRWPPARNQQLQVSIGNEQQPAQVGTSGAANTSSSSTTTNKLSGAAGTATSPKWESPKMSVALKKQPAARASLPILSKSYSLGASPAAATTTIPPEMRDEKKESDSGSISNSQGPDEEEDVASPTPSLRQRISAYTGSTSTKPKTTRPNFRSDKQYAAHFAVREKPPKVDIYDGTAGGSKATDDEKKDDVGDQLGTEHERGPQQQLRSTAAAIARATSPMSPVEVAAARSNNDSSSILKNTNRPSPTRSGSRTPGGIAASGKKLANNFLAAINQSSPRATTPTVGGATTSNNSRSNQYGAPVAEINASTHSGGGGTTGDDIGNGSVHSVAMSSVTADDMGHRSPEPPYSTGSKKPSWTDQRNRLRSAQQHYGSAVTSPAPSSLPAAPPLSSSQQQQSSSSSPAPAVSQEDINRIVDERVRAHVADLETKLGAQMRRFMQQMDDKLLMRVEAMENQIGDLKASIDALQQRQQLR